VQEIVNIEPQLGMTFVPYCYVMTNQAMTKMNITLIELWLMRKMGMIWMLS